MGRPISFQGPDLHLAEALATELGLSPQGLLGHQRIRASRTGMDFILYQMSQLHHIDHPHGHWLVERPTRLTVVEDHLAGGR